MAREVGVHQVKLKISQKIYQITKKLIEKLKKRLESTTITITGAK